MLRATLRRASWCLALAACLPAAGEEPAVLRVAMDTRTPPWVFVPGLDFNSEDFNQPPRVTPAQLQRLEGYEVDILRALERRLGARLHVVPESWYRLEQGLVANRYDLILSSWTPNLRTPEAVAASLPYCDWGLLVVVRAEETRITSYRDLEGKRVGRMRDPAVDAPLRAMGGVHFDVREDPGLMFDALKAGRLDAVIFDSIYVRWRVSLDPAFRAVGEPLNRLGYHVGVRREDRELLARVQAAVKDLVESGESAQLRERWERGGR